ncbi:hypothetical protein [Hydrogenophaga sp.]|uniref:hypothetical protein n=1 Tax=Hydrogenophaga sp. TaxID=1904254 RepID=UPI0025BFC2A2|nr:hypothetical protein [Hydrogenophaga sp.]
MLSLEQAVDAAPSLAALQQRIRDSQRYLDLVKHLLPVSMRPHVHAGPVHDTEWCLLVASAAASTKLRQLVPSLQQVLTQNGAQVSSIRIKVQAKGR